MARVPLADRIQRRIPLLSFPIAVIYKYFDDMGAYLAALLAYYTFVSLIPMLLLAATVLSVVLRGHPDLQQKLLNSALAEFPVVGSQLQAPKALSGGGTGVVVSVVAMLYGSIGAAQALQYAGNTVHQVPRNSRPNPFKARGRSLLILCTFGIGLFLTTVLASTLPAFVHLGGSSGVAVTVLGMVINVLVFCVGFRLATAGPEPWRGVLPGAVVATVLWQVLQDFGVRYVQHVIAKASETNAVFASVLGLLAFLYLAGTVVVISMEVNMVIANHLWPRALLTPFTDAVELTRGDERAYSGQARATRAKGFEQVDVSFHPDKDAGSDAPPGATARDTLGADHKADDTGLED